MKKLFTLKRIILLLFVFSIAQTGKTAVYTAATAGAWSNPLTWGGIVPPFTLINDQVNIPSGMTVVMDGIVVLNDPLASIDIGGVLTSTLNMATITAGNISGNGSFIVGDLSFGAGASFTFSGSLTVDNLSNAAASLSMMANTTVNVTLNLVSGSLVSATGGTITMGTNSTINCNGGTVTSSGGTLGLTFPYYVNYGLVTAVTGVELTGSGLNNITVNVPSVSTVTLGTNVTSSGTLTLSSGTLAIGAHTLTINGSVAGSGFLSGTSSSNLTITTAGGISTPIMFATGGQVLHNLVINSGTGTSVNIGSNLLIMGTLTMTTGSLDITGIDFTLNGTMSGTGSFTTDMNTRLSVSNTLGISTPFNFTGEVGSLTLMANTNTGIVLGTDLILRDTLNLQVGILSLNGHHLTIAGNIVLAPGTISSTAASDISLSMPGTPTGIISFTAGADSVHNMTIDIQNIGAIPIGTHMVITDSLYLIRGFITIQNNSIVIAQGGMIIGASDSSHIGIGAAGYVSMFVDPASTTPTFFPIGTYFNYYPAFVKLVTGSGSGMISIGVTPGVYSGGSAGTLISASQPLVDATWFTQTSISPLNMNIDLMWPITAEVNSFNRGSSYISHYSATMWDTQSPDAATTSGTQLYAQNRNSVIDSGRLAVFDVNTNPLFVSRNMASDGLEIYPNPVSVSLNINNKLSEEILNVEILNMTGQMIGTYTISGTGSSIDLEKLASGQYVMKVFNDKVFETRRVIKL